MCMVSELSFFLGLQIKQDQSGIFISQAKYAKNMIKKFGLETSQSKNTPAATHVKLTKVCTSEAVDIKLYKSMIGSLLYLQLVVPIFLIPWEFALGFNMIFVTHIFKLLNRFSNTFMELMITTFITHLIPTRLL